MNDKKKVITIAALVISIIGLSIGFAAFSSSLSINSRANVDPVNNFSVKFSKVNDALNEEDVSPNNELGTDGQIDNTDNPTISNLNANFTSPGQSVEYTFYARNMGPHIAYLTDVVFNNISGKNKFKSCEPTGENPASRTLLNNVCNDIKVTVKIGNNQEIVLDNTMTKNQIETAIGSNHTIQASSTPESGTTNSEMVKVTIIYQDNGNYADGDFTVTFGDISMTYATLAGYKGETQGQDLAQACEYDESNAVNPFTSTCTYTDLDSSGSITLGDKVTCGSEGFYVIKTPENGIVTMLTEWNLNVSDPDAGIYKGIKYSDTYCATTIGYQDSHVRGWVDEDDPNNLAYLKEVTIYGSGSGSGGSGSYYGSGSGASGSGGGTRTYFLPYGTVAFWSETAMDGYNYDYYSYWTNNSYESLNSNFTACTGANCYEQGGIQYPVNVYGISNTNGATATLTSHVTKYVNALNTALSTNASGRLITYDELSSLGCTLDKNFEGYITCPNSLNWLYNTSYWSGTASGGSRIMGVYTSFNDNYVFQVYITSDFGVRPVIEISSSVIQAS